MNDSELKKTFGIKIKIYREKLGLSQENLSEQLGITQRQVSMIERGLSFPKLSTLNKLLQIFDCTILDLFDNDYLQSESAIKEKINKIMDSCNLKQLQLLYLIAKNM